MKYQDKKAQSAIEFLIIVSAVLFIFLGLLYGVQYNIGEKIRDRNNLEIKELALTVQEEINLAASSTDGYERNFNIPDEIVNRDYEINITDGFVYVRTNDGEFALALPVQNVNGDVIKGNNFIRKRDGAVYLNS